MRRTRRSPDRIAAPWEDPARVDPLRLFHEEKGDFWSALSSTGTTLVVARPSESLVVALGVVDRIPIVSFVRLGPVTALAVDASRGVLLAALSGVPERVLEMAPVTSELPRADAPVRRQGAGKPRWHAPLLPLRSRYYPACLELLDLAFLGGELHGVASGLDAVVRLGEDGGFQPVFWPRAVDGDTGPRFDRNHLRMTSLAAGSELATSFVTATAGEIASTRPGHKGFRAAGRGVLVSLATREPVARDLTRPHSARLFGGRLWLANGGCGEVGVFEEGFFRPAVHLSGFTRGLAFSERIAVAATSRLSRAEVAENPGLAGEPGVCGVHLLDMRTARVLGSVTFPYGGDISAVEAFPTSLSSGFPFLAGGTRPAGSVERLLHGFVFGQRERPEPPA